MLFYKAEERSAYPNFPADLLYIFSSCFYKKLTDFNPNRIRHWTRGVNIFSKEFVIIPVCTGRLWMLVIVKMNYGDGVSIMILDSANRPSSRSNATCRPSVGRLVRNMNGSPNPNKGHRKLHLRKLATLMYLNNQMTQAMVHML